MWAEIQSTLGEIITQGKIEPPSDYSLPEVLEILPFTGLKNLQTQGGRPRGSPPLPRGSS